MCIRDRFYTPQEVSRILAEIVTLGHNRLRKFYDPTCCSGSLLLRAASIGKAAYIYGQEKNPTTYNLARRNMLLHGIRFSSFKIENGDTLEWDAFDDMRVSYTHLDVYKRQIMVKGIWQIM